MGTNTTSFYLDPPQLIGRPNSDGTVTLTPLELKKLNDFNYAVSKMLQGNLNLANLNTETNQVFTDMEGNITTISATANGLAVDVASLKSRNTVIVNDNGMLIDTNGSQSKISGGNIRADSEVLVANGYRHAAMRQGGIYFGSGAESGGEDGAIYYDSLSGELGIVGHDGVNISSDKKTIIEGISGVRIGSNTSTQTVYLSGDIRINNTPIADYIQSFIP